MDMLDSDGVVSRVRKGDLAGALGLPLTASPEALKQQATSLRVRAEAALAVATTETRAACVQALGCLTLVEHVLADAALRRAWDAAFSHVARIPDGVDSAVLAAVHWDWQFVFPEVAREAVELLGHAIRHAAAGELARAIELAQQALQLNPFHVGFRGLVVSWRQALGAPSITPPWGLSIVH